LKHIRLYIFSHRIIKYELLSHFGKVKIVTKLCKHKILEQIEWYKNWS